MPLHLAKVGYISFGEEGYHSNMMPLHLAKVGYISFETKRTVCSHVQVASLPAGHSITLRSKVNGICNRTALGGEQ